MILLKLNIAFQKIFFYFIFFSFKYLIYFIDEFLTILSGLAKCTVSADFLTHEKEMALCNILYSVEDKIEIKKALGSSAGKHNLAYNFVEVFSKTKPFKKDYGSYSEKAIKKLLPLMRLGNYWNEATFDANTHARIEKIITGEYDERIKNRVREKAISIFTDSDFFFEIILSATAN